MVAALGNNQVGVTSAGGGGAHPLPACLLPFLSERAAVLRSSGAWSFVGR